MWPFLNTQGGPQLASKPAASVFVGGPPTGGTHLTYAGAVAWHSPELAGHDELLCSASAPHTCMDDTFAFNVLKILHTTSSSHAPGTPRVFAHPGPMQDIAPNGLGLCKGHSDTIDAIFSDGECL